MKKGFTLIELLAVILILGIIALIAIPTVTEIIEDSKKGALKTSATNLMRIAEEQCNIERMTGEEITNSYTIIDRVISSDLEVKNLPDNGMISVTNDCEVEIAISNNSYCAISKDGEHVSVNSNTYNCNLDYTSIPDTEESCFIFDDATHTITGYHFDNQSCPMDISIPDYINGIPVEHIGDFAFKNDTSEYTAYFGYTDDNVLFYDIVKENLTNKGIELNSIRYFNRSANSAKRCYHPNGTYDDLDLEYVITGQDDYVSCSLRYMTEEYETGNLTGVDLSKAIHLKSIGDSAFMDNKITTVYFGNNPNLVDFGIHTFFKNLISGTVNLSGLTNAKSLGKGAFSRNAISNYTLPAGIEVLDGTFGYNNIEIVTMPNSVKILGEATFAYQPVSQVQYSTNLEVIGEYSFAGSNLTEAVIPDSVKVIGNYAYYNSPNFTNLTLGNDVETIGEFAFYQNNISSIVFNNKLKIIKSGAFSFNSLKNLNFPNSLEIIEYAAFSSNNSISSLTMNEGLKSIGEVAFYGNKITSINIPSSVENLGDGCFTRNKVTGNAQFITKLTNGISDPTVLISTASADTSTVTIPSTITTLNPKSLQNINAANIIIPDSVTTIKAHAIEAQYRKNSNITIGTGITTIEDNAFACEDSNYCKYNLTINKLQSEVTGGTPPWGNPYMTITWNPVS